MQRIVAVFGASSSQPGDGHYDAGVTCGRLLAERGFVVATGGYFGTMEAVSKGAREAGGTVIGVTAPSVFPGRSGANAHVTEERPAHSLISRIEDLTGLADASIALWGSLGTATELLVAWNEAYVAPFSGRTRKPLVAVGAPWDLLVPHLETSLDTHTGIVTVVPTVDEAVAAVDAALG